MKRILRKTVFITIVAFIVFALVASTGSKHRILSQEINQVEDCLIADYLGDRTNLTKLTCTNYPRRLLSPNPVSKPTPNLQLPEKQRFLAAITDKLPTLPQPNTYEYTLLRAYGAAFVNQNPEVQLPQKVVFANEQETKAFQSTLTMGKVNGTNNCYLQKAAAEALNQAKAQLAIPLKSGYGASDCTRNFATNLKFWRKYANDKTLARVQQGEETKILSTVAPPGASQHLWGLAIDLRVANEAQKQTLNQYGWFRTVENDVPHWTYVGLPPEQLAELGFKNKLVRGVNYWVTPL